MDVPLFVKIVDLPSTVDLGWLTKGYFELFGTRWDTDDKVVTTAAGYAVPNAGNFTATEAVQRWLQTPVYIYTNQTMTNDFRGVFALHYKGGHTDGYWYLVQYSKRGSNAYNVIARSHNCNADPTKQANSSQTLRSTWEFQARELDPYRGHQRGEGVG